MWSALQVLLKFWPSAILIPYWTKFKFWTFQAWYRNCPMYVISPLKVFFNLIPFQTYLGSWNWNMLLNRVYLSYDTIINDYFSNFRPPTPYFENNNSPSSPPTSFVKINLRWNIFLVRNNHMSSYLLHVSNFKLLKISWNFDHPPFCIYFEINSRAHVLVFHLFHIHKIHLFRSTW